MAGPENLRPSFVAQLEKQPNIGNGRHHRGHHVRRHARLPRGAPYRPQLRQQQLSGVRREPNRPHSQERIRLIAPAQIRRPLVAPDIRQPDHDRPIGPERLHDLPIRGHLLVLGWRGQAAQEEVLGAEQTDALRPGVECAGRVVGAADVRPECDPLTVRRRSGPSPESGRLARPRHSCGTAVLQFTQQIRPRVHEDLARVTVDGELRSRPRRFDQSGHPDDRRHPQAAGENRDMSRRRAAGQRHSQKNARRQLGQQRRRQVLADDDGRHVWQRNHDAVQHTGDAPGHVSNIGRPGRQPRIGQRREQRRGLIGGEHQCRGPSHSPSSEANGGVDEDGILGDERLRREDLGLAGMIGVTQPLGEGVELGGGGVRGVRRHSRVRRHCLGASRVLKNPGRPHRDPRADRHADDSTAARIGKQPAQVVDRPAFVRSFGHYPHSMAPLHSGGEHGHDATSIDRREPKCQILERDGRSEGGPRSNECRRRPGVQTRLSSNFDLDRSHRNSFGRRLARGGLRS